jgi:hypothetical protein
MDLQLRFTDKDITPWGGMALIKRMLDHLDFQSVLSHCGLPAPGSNRAYPSEQLITQFILSIWCGANRFEHCEVTRFDAALARIFDIERMANFKAITALLCCTAGSLSKWARATSPWTWTPASSPATVSPKARAKATTRASPGA